MEMSASTQKGGLAATIMAQASSLSSSWWCVTTRLTAALKWWLNPVPSLSREKKSSKVITVNATAVKETAAVQAASRKAAAKAAVAEAAAQFESCRPSDPVPPAAAPWRFSNVSIHTVEHVDPPLVVSSRQTMERLGWRLRLAGFKPDVLERMTGIRERRMWEAGTTVVQAATWAGRKALESSGIDPSRIGVICNTSVSRDFLEPGIAVCVAHKLGLPASCVNLDITNACVGMMNGLLTVASMIEAGVCDYGLLVDAETSQELYEATMSRMCRTYNLQQFRKQLASLTLGCGAVAIVLCRSDLAPPGRNHRLTGAVARAAPYACGMCRGDLEKMETDPKMVLHGGLVINQTWQVAKEAFGWSADSVDLWVAHQVSKKGLDFCVQLLGLDAGNFIQTYQYLGNVGPANLGIALSTAVQEDRLKEGMRVALVAVGSGINCLMAEVIW